MAKFILKIDEEDDSISQMAKTLSVKKKEVILMSLNLLNYVLEQRRLGNYLTLSKDENKTKDILTEANAGDVSFKME